MLDSENLKYYNEIENEQQAKLINKPSWSWWSALKDQKVESNLQ